MHIHKEIYLEKEQEISADRADWQKKTYESAKTIYKGRRYESYRILEHPLTGFEKIKIRVKALLTIIANFAKKVIFPSTVVFSAYVQDLRSLAKEGVERERYWKFYPPLVLDLDNFDLKHGFSLSAINPKEKAEWTRIINTWYRQNPAKNNWSLAELAALFEQAEPVIKKLLDLVCLASPCYSRDDYTTWQIDKLFHSIIADLYHEPQLKFQPGVKALWNGRIENANKLFGTSMRKDEWTLEELGRFLAVSEKALIEFFGPKEIYSFTNIQIAINTRENADLNEILEKNRTQQNSIRWGMLGS